jgi:hypothetical protein
MIINIRVYLCLEVLLIFVSPVRGDGTGNLLTNLTFGLTRAHEGSIESEFKANEVIDYRLLGPESYYVYLRGFPVGNFEFHLFDSGGRDVRKTRAGLDLTRTPPRPTKSDLQKGRTSDFFRFSVGKRSVEWGVLFRPDDIFAITNKGAYEMEVRMRVCVIMTNGLPDLSAMTNGLNVLSRGVSRANDFGVLELPPFRCKVVKE